ncbi:MAG TPA: PEP-CTERM sorting domain-containing protein [Phycisphaerae bacterium]|nr:PEP-CTERM sorting domain-containing protein [Phycisphaerae bacterium]HQA00390.1 PEP-CTERM sorting domain-containing protein [Phycisphaerae bacterium]
MHVKNLQAHGVAIAVSSVLAVTAQASPVFFLNPDGNLTTADPTRDLPFQAAVGAFTEFDFIQYGHEYVMEPSNLYAGSVQVRPNLLDVNGNNAADLAVNGNRLIETYPVIVPAVPGIVEGSPNGGAALLNRTFAGSGDAVGAAVEFTFSQPVRGFGTWIMDDIIEPSQFVLEVTEAGGAIFTSAAMESGNGTNLAIEGFLGVVSDVGITRVVVWQQKLDGTPSNADFFYLDHVQVGDVVPEPATALLLILGMAGLVRRRGRA